MEMRADHSPSDAGKIDFNDMNNTLNIAEEIEELKAKLEQTDDQAKRDELEAEIAKLEQKARESISDSEKPETIQ